MVKKTGRQSFRIRKSLTDCPRKWDQSKASDRVQYLEVYYPDLVANPQPILTQLQTLLGPRFTPGPAVLQTIQPGLYRNRT